MVFKENFVAVIKANGQILREHDKTVYLPFGNEYSILLKNLGSTRAVVNISIDGEDVLDGHRLVVDANSDYELERFIIDDNLSKGPRFKFIEKTEKITEHRGGDKIDDGIIRIEYRFENNYTLADKIFQTYNYSGGTGTPIIGGSDPTNVMYTTSMSNTSNIASGLRGLETNVNCCNNICDDGITTKGRDSNQAFQATWVADYNLEPTSNVISFQLKGENPNYSKVIKPKTIKCKTKCDCCGTLNTSRNKCCGECGTNLTW